MAWEVTPVNWWKRANPVTRVLFVVLMGAMAWLSFNMAEAVFGQAGFPDFPGL